MTGRRLVILALMTLTLAIALAPRAPAVAATIPNDPLYRLDQGYLAEIHAPDAWELQTGDARVTVAVIDDGLDLAHPDLAHNLWMNPQPGAGDCGDDLHGCNFLDPNAAAGSCSATAAVHTPDISPTGWHGSFLAGVIGAAGNNGEGIAGVAWNVGLMAVRVSDCKDKADATAVVNAIHYAVDHGARVIDVGVQSSRAAGGGCKPPNRPLADAVQYARDHGALVVAGAGDRSRSCVDDPAAAMGALAVGGLRLPQGDRWRGARTTGSNWGAEIAVAAPANDIIGTVPRRPDQQPPNDRYAATSSTTAAAAIVSGEAALLLAQNSLLTPDWLTQLITLGAHSLPDGTTPGWAGAGAIDLAASLRLVPAAYYGALTLGGAPATDGTLVEGYVGGLLCAQSSSFSVNGESQYALYVPAAAMRPGCGVPGGSVEIRVEGATAATLPWGAAAYPLELDVEPAAPMQAAPADFVMFERQGARVRGSGEVVAVVPAGGRLGPIHGTRRCAGCVQLEQQ